MILAMQLTSAASLNFVIVVAMAIGIPIALAMTAAGQESNHSSVAAWPTIRGPALDGHALETGIAARWPVEGPPILWVRTLGQGYSAFIAWDNCVATQFQTLGGQYVICLEADSGATK